VRAERLFPGQVVSAGWGLWVDSIASVSALIALFVFGYLITGSGTHGETSRRSRAAALAVAGSPLLGRPLHGAGRLELSGQTLISV
jgi:hypothetical protein